MAPRSVLLALVVLAAGMALTLGPAAAQEPIAAVVTGPNAIGPGQVTAYNVTIVGGPVGHVNYTVQWHVTGPDVAGALPTSANPTSTTTNRTAIQVNITAPPKDQDITLVVKVSAQVGPSVENATVEKIIMVITPIVLSASFRNDGTTAALNVTARFYVDDALVGTKKVARIASGVRETVTLNYLPVGLQPGSHRVRIEADLDGNGVIDPARGEAVVSDLFYRSTTPPSTGWTVVIGIGVFLPVLLVTIALRRRQRA